MIRFTPGNTIELLRSGSEFFPALTAAIDAATREVWLETYIFADDAAGRADRGRARARGGTRRDGAGAGRRLGRQALSHQAARALAARRRRAAHEIPAGGRTVAIPLAPAAAPASQALPRGPARRVRRRHQPHRRHEHAAPEAAAARLRGARPRPAARADRGRPCSACGRWSSSCSSSAATCRCSPIPSRRRRAGTQTAKFVIRDNLRYRRDIERAYLAAIRTAKQRDPHRQRLFLSRASAFATR